MTPVRRVFVLGCPRSGTTLVQSLLTAHSGIVSFRESHFFDQGFTAVAPGRYVTRGRAARRREAFIRANDIGPEAVRAAGRGRAARPGAGRSAVGIGADFVRLLDEAAGRRDAAAWVEKTPDHVFRIPLIRRAAPDARFVHVVRAGPDVVASLHEATRAWGHPRSRTRCAAHWLAAVLASRRHAGRAGHLVVGYERLCAAPADETRRIVEWLGLAWEPEILERYADAAEAVVGGGESWKSSNFGRIRSRPTRPLSSLPPLPRALVGAGLPAHRGLLRLASGGRRPGAAAPVVPVEAT